MLLTRFFLSHRVRYGIMINSDQGGEVDGPGRGGAPLPWDMDEPPANMFKEEVIMVMIRMIFVIFLSVF